MLEFRLIVALILAASGTLSAQGGTPSDSLIGARVDSLLAVQIAPDGPGCSVGIQRREGPPILRARGSASLEFGVPLTPETILDAASLAKQFTAAAVVLLASQGKLSLDDDVRRYVPELPRYQATITLRHLMHHTSGLRDQWELLWLSGGRDDDATEQEDVLALLARQRELNFAPGTTFLYTNSGYTLLALVVERASGSSLREYAAREIFQPLGMTRTFFLDDRFRVVPGVASGYRKARPGAGWGRSAYLRDVYGSGGLFTTAGDLLRWYDMLNRGTLAGGRVRQEAEHQGTLVTGDSIGYSMGLESGTLRGRRYLRHGGNDLGVNAYAIHLPDDRLSAVALCNGRELDSFTLVRQSIEPFLPPPGPASRNPAATSPAVAPSTAELRAFAGIYYNPATLATRVVELRNGVLHWVRGGSATPLDPVGDRRFRFPPGQPAELEFPPRRAGAPQEMRLISGGSITPYQQAEPFAVSSGSLMPYSGAFSSDELGVTLIVTTRDSLLEIGTPGSWSFQAQPIFRDAFAIPEAVVLRFTRDRRGRVTGFVADMARSRGIRFRRSSPPAGPPSG